MVKLRCQECGEVIDGKKSDLDSECEDCGGDYAIKGSEDDEYEEEEYEPCARCGKKITAEDGTGQCVECDDEICEDCSIILEESDNLICKRCIDKVYPRNLEPKIEYKEKIVEKLIYVDKEGNPLNTSFNSNNKSKFD